MTSAASNRRTFLIVAGLFLLPFLAAYVAYRVLGLVPSGHINYGRLIDPARPLPALNLLDVQGAAVPAAGLRGKWSLVYLGAAQCGDACQTRLLLFRQIRLALGKDLQRAQRVYIAPNLASANALHTQLAPLHPDLRIFADAGAPGARAADFFQGGDADAIYAVDPHGNWFMVYSGDLDPKGVYGDLHKLMQLSTIG